MASAERSSISHQNQQQQQQDALKCPRCNSSNTKFCYYNNYSLSQPRHLCKACKRYWTRGGTLRNVPVGGGCRKNKRIKRALTTVDHSPKPNFDQSTPSINTNLNPLYGLLQQNPKYPRFSTRVSDINISDTDHVSRFDLVLPPDQMSSLELGFGVHNSDPLVSSYPSMFSDGLITSTCNGDHTMASLLSSNLQPQPTFSGFAAYGDEGGSELVHDVQRGIQKSSTDWNNSFNGTQNEDNDHIKALESSDPASFLWSITGGDCLDQWHDPTSNLSVPSLI